MLKLKKYILDIEDDSIKWRRKCLDIVYGASSIHAVQDYIQDILVELDSGNDRMVSEALNVALVLTYRLGIDDSSNNERIAAQIKDKCCALMHPVFYRELQKEIEHLCLSYHRSTYARLGYYLPQIVSEINECLKSSGFYCKGYGRKKTPYSIFEKLIKYAVNKKSLKKLDIKRNVSLCSTLAKFEADILSNMGCDYHNRFSYNSEDIDFILPDLLAATLQFPSSFVKKMNLGTTKRRYEHVYRILKSSLEATIYWGPDYSTKWHMNRLVFYALFKRKKCIRLPIEIFIRTDYDYYIGYANYWQYKNVSLLKDISPNGQRKRAQFLNRIKKCENYEEVQELVFQQVRRGQMMLF